MPKVASDLPLPVQLYTATPASAAGSGHDGPPPGMANPGCCHSSLNVENRTMRQTMLGRSSGVSTTTGGAGWLVDKLAVRTIHLFVPQVRVGFLVATRHCLHSVNRDKVGCMPWRCYCSDKRYGGFLTIRSTVTRQWAIKTIGYTRSSEGDPHDPTTRCGSTQSPYGLAIARSAHAGTPHRVQGSALPSIL